MNSLKPIFKKINMHIFPSKIRACIIGIFIMTICPSVFCVENLDMNLPRRIDSLISIQNATVVLIPRNSYFRAKLSEDMLLKVGCVYSTGDRQLIADLKNVLSRNDLKFSENDDSQFDLRYGIFLNLGDKTIVKFLFGEPFSGQTNVGGTFSQASNLKNLAFTAASSLPPDLMIWAKKASLSDTNDSKIKESCLRDVDPK
jgi:hypothetical protein